MVSPVKRTFHLLLNSANSSAMQILISAMDSNNSNVVKLAVEALCNSNVSFAHNELINNYDEFTSNCKNLICKNASNMTRALENVIRNGSLNRKTSAIEIIIKGEVYDMIKGLLKVLQDAEYETERNQIISCIKDLTNSLYEKITESRSSKGKRTPNIKNIIRGYITAIEHTVHDMSLEKYHSKLLEFIMIIGNPEDVSVGRILKSSDLKLAGKAEQVILTSQHVGVMTLAAKYMSWKLPHHSAITAFEKRTDPEFVYTILREFPEKVTDLDRKNYGQLVNISWLAKKESLIVMMSPSLQVKMVKFASILGMPDIIKTSFFQWVVSNCCSEACHQASNVLSGLKADDVLEMLSDGLESKNEGVQAWAVSQLREQHVPDAIQMIMERLDSPSEVVKEAARNELGSFDVTYIMQIYEKLNPESYANVAMLLKKVDPDFLDKFREFLSSAIIDQRLRAIQVVDRLGLSFELLPELLLLANDKDQQIKRTLTELLKKIPVPEVYETLNQLLKDENGKVKQGASDAIKDLSKVDWLKHQIES